MAMNKALHPGDDISTLYMSRKQGGRVLANVEDSVHTLIR